MTSFAMNPQLVAATIPVGDLPLCRILLIDEHRYPWVLMVPRRDNLREIVDLGPADRAVFIEELAAVSTVMRDAFGAHGLNVADIGNKTPQLHVHVIVRQTDDPAWPGVVWSEATEPYADRQAADEVRNLILAGLSKQDGFRQIDVHTDPGTDHA
jgi:diadenosine tetraphosphate (Ap4A) HIT family hydrolase